MSNWFFRLWAEAFLLFCMSSSSWAQVIHWELDAFMGTPNTSQVSNERSFSGGFDFNTITQEISNVSIKTSGGNACQLCFDYTGATGNLIPDSFSSVYIRKRVDFEPPLYRTNSLIFHIPDAFKPATYTDVNFTEYALFFIDDPLDPDIFVEDGCAGCATWVGTLVPIPEPETYAMLLAGLGLLGFQCRKSRREGIDITLRRQPCIS